MKAFKFSICCLFFLACLPGAFAQVPPVPSAGIELEQRRIQQQQQQLIERQMRERELRDAEAGRPAPQKAAQPTSPESTPSEPSAEPAKSAPGAERCVEIREVEFSGNTILSDNCVRKMIAPYFGRCLTMGDIDRLLKTITNAYMDKGYITSGAFMVMPQPKLKEGVLTIRIMEAKVSRIEGLPPAEQVTAFPLLEESILNLRDIEQGLEQINRLGSNRATMDVKADPERDGTSLIIVKNEPAERSHWTLFTDNSGSESTGEHRVGLRMSEDNLLDLNDQINLAYTNSLVDEWGHKQSKSAIFGISIPLGWWTFFNNLSYSYYKTSVPLPISGTPFYSFGDTITDSFSVERMLARGQTYKLAANAGITYRNSDNYTRVYDLEIKNEMSSRALSVLNFDLPLTLYFNGGMVYLKPGWAHGIRAFGSFDDTDSPYSQKAQYDAYKLYVYSGWNFGCMSLSTTIDSQYSRDELFSSEALYVGGEYSVRGFRNDSVQGESGFSVRNDLSLNLGRIFEGENRWLAAFTPGVFVDFGRVFPNSELQSPASLAGAGVKLGFRHGMFDAGVSWAKVLKREDWMTESSALYFSAGLGGRF